MTEIRIIEKRFEIDYRGGYNGLPNTYYPQYINDEILEARVKEIGQYHVMILFVVKIKEEKAVS